MLDLESCLQIAKSAAFLAGDYLKKQQTNNLKILSNNARDLKLQIDIDAEEIIKEQITQKSSLPILAEESGISGEIDEIFLGSGPIRRNIKFFKKYSNFMCFYLS
jgi:fructose-1,6-bisphosphatase/inositol monophosphatase family enzyme